VITHLYYKKTGFAPVFLCLLFYLTLTACSPSLELQVDRLKLPVATTQVLLVTSTNWEISTASLQRLERHYGHWQYVGNSIPVRLGRNGLGWGVGLHVDGVDGTQKIEGDGKAPAGIFPLGMAFGYANKPPIALKMPYRVAGERDYFVDAVDSPDYNRWRTLTQTQANKPKQHWSSFERMRRLDHQYEYGMIVGHNLFPTIAGRGSAIFLHVWLDPQTPTSGCTAMAVDDLREVLAWLKLPANPLLIQTPLNTLADLQFQGFQ